MPRNLRGGKNFKKGKKSAQAEENEENIQYIEKEPDQMVGRLVKLLGNMATQVLCEDNVLRICKIASSLKRKVRFAVGDVVLVSLRDFEVPAPLLKEGVRGSRGDICGKYNPLQYQRLRDAGINHAIFAQMETVDGIVTSIDVGEKADTSKVEKKEDLFADDSSSESSGDMDDAAIDDI
jgi:initiation factor 1A